MSMTMIKLRKIAPVECTRAPMRATRGEAPQATTCCSQTGTSMPSLTNRPCAVSSRIERIGSRPVESVTAPKVQSRNRRSRLDLHLRTDTHTTHCAVWSFRRRWGRGKSRPRSCYTRSSWVTRVIGTVWVGKVCQVSASLQLSTHLTGRIIWLRKLALLSKTLGSDYSHKLTINSRWCHLS